jgi:hypothetical protein
MNKIKAFVTFPNYESAGLVHMSYAVELPDFRAYQPDYTEENRKFIKKFYSEVADSDCYVIFDFEMPKNASNG